MRICSLTLVRDNPHDADAAQETAKPLVDYLYTRIAGEITDFAAERNDLLEWAHRKEYDWAIMLDTDERLIWKVDPGQFWWALGETTTDVIMVPHVSGIYDKERIFRLPAKGHYHGRTHEAWITDDGAVRTTWRTSLAFDEVPKTPEQTQAKLQRDVGLLKEQIIAEPSDPRWRYYLGDTYANLGQIEDAKREFSECHQLHGWDEESAWAAYRIAELWAGEEGYWMGIHWCAMGMERHPGMAELPWLAGWCCYKLGLYEHAIRWSQMAVALNEHDAHRDRIGFRHPPALNEGPWDVMRWAYGELDNPAGKEWAEEGFRQATNPLPR